MKTKFFFILGCFYLVNFYGQIGELDRFDCNYSKEVTVPFNYSENQVRVKPQLNQVVFYSYRDQFTYWYKITVKKNETLRFQISSINDSDSYAVYIYQYNKTNFCSELYNQKIKPIISPFYVGNGSNVLESKANTLNVQAGNIYYISILNTSLNNCGHLFNLSYGEDTLKVKALHLPCKKDITTLPITQKVTTPVLIIKDTVKVFSPLVSSLIKDTGKEVNPKITSIIMDTVKGINKVLETNAFNNMIVCFVKDSKKLILINARLTIFDEDNKEYLPLINSTTGQWNGIIEKNKYYKLKCTSLGYKDLEMKLDITKGNTVELLLEPLKIGDNFVMRSIYFHPNTYALRKESSEELQKLLTYLLDNPSVVIEIQGHTNGDNKIYKNKAYIDLGEEWNFQGSSKKLSLKRAEAIKNYLINNGIAAEKLIPEGYGGIKAIIKYPETMEEGQRNIRVEVVILKN